MMVKVITYGTFDLFHEGHYRLLKRAKELGDYLVVGVTTEGYDNARGKLGVVDSLPTRIENVKSTGFADEVIVEEYEGQKFNDIKRYDIDIFAIGSDWVGKFDYLNKYCQVVYLERTKNISSTMLRAKKRNIHRIGIIGTGRIAKRFVTEAKLVSGLNVQGVYNPHTSSVVKFAKSNDLNAYLDIEEFFDNVDLVYIASPHETHFEYIMKSLEHNKHTICEKPLALRYNHAVKAFELAKKENLILIEGIKTAYCPGFNKLIGIACSGKIGTIRNIDACFTKLEQPNRRELVDVEYGGSFLELGSYVTFPAIKLFGTEYENVRFESIKSDNGLDIFTKASFKFPTGLATATCGLGVKSDGQLTIAGTKGYIKVVAPWWKTNYFEVHYENPDEIEKYSDVFLGDGMRYEINYLLKRIDGTIDDSQGVSRNISLSLAKIMEQFLNHKEMKGRKYG